jgi:hypothetical protein
MLTVTALPCRAACPDSSQLPKLNERCYSECGCADSLVCDDEQQCGTTAPLQPAITTQAATMNAVKTWGCR